MMPPHKLKFRHLQGPYAILRFAPSTAVPEWATKGDFTSISRSSDELSIVCAGENLPAKFHSAQQWQCFKLEGPFPFSETGVLLSFIGPLSSNSVPIFAISTYDTDYVLVQTEYVGTALGLLQQAGHELCPGDEQ